MHDDLLRAETGLPDVSYVCAYRPGTPSPSPRVPTADSASTGLCSCSPIHQCVPAFICCATGPKLTTVRAHLAGH
jgi:hypothetical protein